MKREETVLGASRLALFVWLEIMVRMVLHVSMASVHLLDVIDVQKQFFVGRRSESALRGMFTAPSTSLPFSTNRIDRLFYG